jgi:GT2 family glycosyltransferase
MRNVRHTNLPGEDDIIAFLHDDLYIHEQGWDERVLQAFRDHPKVGLIGFGGSTALGSDDIYKVPYEINQLARQNFYSNMRGAEIHGTRTTTDMPIVYNDGFSMIVRRSLLDKIDGWAWLPSEMVAYAYDYGLACMNRRHGYEARLLALDVEHGDATGMGGVTRDTAFHRDMSAKYGGDEHVHTVVHRYIYDTFKDVLPLRLP